MAELPRHASARCKAMNSGASFTLWSQAPRQSLRSIVWFTVKVAMLYVAVFGVIPFSGCMYALNKTNMPSTEKIKVEPAAGGNFAIRIENQEETPVPADGKIELTVPSLPRGCSVYLFGVIKVREGSPEYAPAIQVIRNGKLMRKLSLHSLHQLPADSEGYRLVKL